MSESMPIGVTWAKPSPTELPDGWRVEFSGDDGRSGYFDFVLHEPQAHPDDSTRVAKGFVKFDGCMNVDCDGSAWHFCGVDGIEELARALQAVRCLAYERFGNAAFWCAP